MVIKDLWKYYGDELVFAEFPPPLTPLIGSGWSANGAQNHSARVLAGELDAERGLSVVRETIQ